MTPLNHFITHKSEDCVYVHGESHVIFNPFGADTRTFW